MLAHWSLLSQPAISSVPWLRLCSAPVRADALWVVAAVRSSGPAAAQVEAAAVVLDHISGHSSEGAAAVSPAVALDWASLSCRWAGSPELVCPCSRNIAARFS